MDYPNAAKQAPQEDVGSREVPYRLTSVMRCSWRQRSSRLEPIFLFLCMVLLSAYATVSSLSNQGPSPEEQAIYERTLKICTNKSEPQKWPMLIHQTWKDHNVPERFHKDMKTCKDLNPDYKYMFWTDDDINEHIRTKYPWFWPIFNRYPYPIQKVDAGRLFIMHYYGGVYMDMDITCKVPLTKIHQIADSERSRPADVILANTDPFGITNNVLMGRAGDPFYDFLIHRLPVTFGHRFTPHWTVMLSAGPLFLYRSYNMYPCKSDIYLISTKNHSEVYFNHTQARTWHSWDGWIITWFDYHGRTLIKMGGALLILLIIIGVLYRYRRVIGKKMQRKHERWPSESSDSWKLVPNI